MKCIFILGDFNTNFEVKGILHSRGQKHGLCSESEEEAAHAF